MRVVVTGCTGFVGSRIVPELTKAGYCVTGIVEPGVASGPADVSLLTVDISTGNRLAAASMAYIPADPLVRISITGSVVS